MITNIEKWWEDNGHVFLPGLKGMICDAYLQGMEDVVQELSARLKVTATREDEKSKI